MGLGPIFFGWKPNVLPIYEWRSISSGNAPELSGGQPLVQTSTL